MIPSPHPRLGVPSVFSQGLQQPLSTLAGQDSYVLQDCVATRMSIPAVSLQEALYVSAVQCLTPVPYWEQFSAQFPSLQNLPPTNSSHLHSPDLCSLPVASKPLALCKTPLLQSRSSSKEGIRSKREAPFLNPLLPAV